MAVCDSFNNGFLRPNPIRGFPGDQTLCEAMEVDQNCYGALQDPFQVSGAIWSSSDAGVATVDGAGLATAQNVGSANIRASWETLRFLGGVGTCRQSSANFVAEALCNVLRPEVLFLDATLYNLKEDFLNNRVTLSAAASGHGAQICDQGRSFQLTAHFLLPDDARALSTLRSYVKVFGEPPNTNNYIVGSWTFANERLTSAPKSADIIITLYRRPGPPTPEVPYEIIIVNVAGDYEFGGFSSPANVKITCP